MHASLLRLLRRELRPLSARICISRSCSAQALIATSFTAAEPTHPSVSFDISDLFLLLFLLFLFLFGDSGVVAKRRGNIALIATLPVSDCLNSVQHLQSRCLEDSFLPQQTRKKGTAKAQSHQHIVSHLQQSSDYQAPDISLHKRPMER